MSAGPSSTFGPFTLQPMLRRLLEDGRPVQVGARAFDLLVALVENRHRVMSRDELLARVWPGLRVEPFNLTVSVSSLRKALRDTDATPAFISTISGRGYRFVAPVVPGAETPAYDAAAARPPGIAVLPFENLGGDVAQDHFGNGIAEDIISELSRNRWLTVIARNSSFSFQARGADIRDISNQLGVRYVLTGSLRTAGSRIRVTANLIDAGTSSPLIADRFDRELTDLFTIQDEITALIIASVRPALYEAEQARSIRRHPDSIDAWSAYQRGVWLFSSTETPNGPEAQAWFARAMTLDPTFAPGYYGAALVHLHDGSAFVPGTAPDWQARGEALALRAVGLDPRDSGAQRVLGLARMLRGDHSGAVEATDTALDLNPNDATAHGTAGAALVFSGRPLDGLLALGHSLRLSPRDPRLRIRYAHVGLGHWFARQYPEAEATAALIARRWPQYGFSARLLAMVFAETGRIDDARAALARARCIDGAPYDDFVHARMPWYRPEDHARALAALRLAGLE